MYGIETAEMSMITGSRACANIWNHILKPKVYLKETNTFRESAPHFSRLVINILYKELCMVEKRLRSTDLCGIGMVGNVDNIWNHILTK